MAQLVNDRDEHVDDEPGQGNDERDHRQHRTDAQRNPCVSAAFDWFTPRRGPRRPNIDNGRFEREFK